MTATLTAKLSRAVKRASPRPRGLAPATALRKTALAIALASVAVVATAQNKPFEPQVGQEGKDVIWVPTPDGLVERMLRMAGVSSSDFVTDLGSGDGRTVIAAARNFGARAQGIEYNPDMVELSKKNAAAAGVSDRATFMKADIFEYDFSKSTVVTMYLLTDLNMKLRPKLLDMKPGTRLVSHQFRMGEWEPDQTVAYDGRPAYMWIVPAKVAGNWQLVQGNDKRELVLGQHFQSFGGVARAGEVEHRLTATSLRGAQISFELPGPKGVGRRFVGRVDGDTMSGTGAGGNWTAKRAGS